VIVKKFPRLNFLIGEGDGELELNEMIYVKGLALSRYDRYVVNHHRFKGCVLNLRSVFSLNSCTLMGV